MTAESVVTTLTVQTKLIADLHPHPQNYRRHGPEQLEVLLRSLRDHGLQKPVVVTSDGTILAGHGLVEAAQAEGRSEIVVHVYDGAHPDAFVAADNYSASLATDDEQALAELLRRLEADGELSASGYEPEDLGELIARLEAAEKSGREETWEPPEELPEGPTRVQPGDLWQLGEHRLLCGDCTLPENWERLMAGEVAQAIVTDPPYAVNYVGGGGGKIARYRSNSSRSSGVNRPPSARWPYSC